MGVDFGWKPPKKGKNSILGGGGILGGLGDWGVDPKGPKPTERGTLYSADKDKILERQKGKCAGKKCSQHHGKKLPVNIRSHFDHIKPLALGGKDIRSNIQALCANCHQEKTREDRKKIAEAKNGGKKGGGSTTSGDGPFGGDIFGGKNIFGKPPKGGGYSF